VLTRIEKWDHRFLDMAKLISTWSKDPSTQVGAVIIRPDMSICSLGFNGFAMGMNDNTSLYQDRESKYSRIIHAEMNAILLSNERLYGYTLYTYPFSCCDRCAPHVIQSGIKRVVSYINNEPRWDKSLQDAIIMFTEANVGVMLYCQ